MLSDLSREQIRQLTKLGARVRLAEIKQEEAALNAILNGGPNGARPKQSTSPEPVRRRWPSPVSNRFLTRSRARRSLDIRRKTAYTWIDRPSPPRQNPLPMNW